MVAAAADLSLLQTASLTAFDRSDDRTRSAAGKCKKAGAHPFVESEFLYSTKARKSSVLVGNEHADHLWRHIIIQGIHHIDAVNHVYHKDQ